MVAIIGGNFERFRPLVDLYRDAGMKPDTVAINWWSASTPWGSSAKRTPKPGKPSSPAGRT
jgi:hypothetical protein